MAESPSPAGSAAAIYRLLEDARTGVASHPRSVAKALRSYADLDLSEPLLQALQRAASRAEYQRLTSVLAYLATDAAVAALEEETRTQRRWRAAVFAALGRCRHPRSALVLLEWFHGNDSRKRAWATRAMGRLADPKTYVALRDRYAGWRERSADMSAAVDALPPVATLARKALAAQGMTPAERLAALEAARDLRGGLLFDVRRYLRRAAASRDAKIRQAASELLDAADLVRPAGRGGETDLRPAGSSPTDGSELLRASDPQDAGSREQPAAVRPGLLRRIGRWLGRSDEQS